MVNRNYDTNLKHRRLKNRAAHHIGLGTKLRNDFSKAGHWLEREGDKVWKGATSVFRAVEKEVEPLAKDALGAIDNTFKATGNLANGIGNTASSFKYIPYMLAGLVLMLIVNAKDVGGAVANIGRAVR